MLGCLLAAVQVHAHESGIQDVDHACISCDLEALGAHAAMPSSFDAACLTCVGKESADSYSMPLILAESSSDIRGPPINF